MREQLNSNEDFFVKHGGLSIPHPLECLNISVSTVCSLECRICAYRYSKIPRQRMDNEFFYSVINRAIRFGYHAFNLTPIVGEVLMDPGFLDKLIFLDNHPGVKFFFFSSNLTHANDRFFSTVKALKKLRWFSVSLYGLNPEDYHKMTGAPQAIFASVVQNLERLLKTESFAGRSEVKVRGPGARAASLPARECVEILNQLSQHGIQIRYGVRIMNWGGIIKRSEIADLDLDYKSLERQRTLPCIFIFHKPNILPDGTVNACSCGDAHAALSIGNLRQQHFSDIFSVSNRVYMQILQRQISEQFSVPCSICSGYRPLNQHWYSYEYYDRDFIPLQGFLNWLSEENRKTADG
jgi:MoaA/NifB/PqqE/SkfB family radical SAM enzyme